MILERKTTLNIEQLTSNTKQLLSTDLTPEKMMENLKDFLVLQNLYDAAIKEISTKLEIIDNEFQILYSHNPIHHIESRLKSPESIAKKLRKIGMEPSTKSIMKNITDIAGLRVICYYLDEIYTIADLLSKLDGIKVLDKKDYIKNPKPSGYRSLHIIVSVPIYFSKKTEIVPVEIQIRTIAMDFWASLEHQLRYKNIAGVDDELFIQLKECSDEISSVDKKMQNIFNSIRSE
jgi:putative GTP pyrophosphokinase